MARAIDHERLVGGLNSLLCTHASSVLPSTGGIIGDQQGLGKTLEVLALVASNSFDADVRARERLDSAAELYTRGRPARL